MTELNHAVHKRSRVIFDSLLTGHTDLNRHLHVMGLHQDSLCPLCQEVENTIAHFIAQCSALMLLQKNILGGCTLLLDTLNNIQRFHLLKFAKATKRFYWRCSLSVVCAFGPRCGLSTG